MKKCFVCNKEKEIDEYYKHPQMIDGYLNKCKECCKYQIKKSRIENPEKHKIIDRKKYLKRREIALKQSAHYARTNKKAILRKRAASLVGFLIKKGFMKRQKCSIDGCEEIAQAHHSDYNKEHWKDIEWLCKWHHSQWHRHNDPIFPDSKTIEKLIKVKTCDICDAKLGNSNKKGICKDCKAT